MGRRTAREGRSGVGCQARSSTQWCFSSGPTNRARRGAVLAGTGGAMGGCGKGAGLSLLRAPPRRGVVGHLPAGSQVLAVGCRAGVPGPPRHTGRGRCGGAALTRPPAGGGGGVCRPVTAPRLRGCAGALARLYEVHHSGTAMEDAHPTLPHHSDRIQSPPPSPPPIPSFLFHRRELLRRCHTR